MRNDNLWEEKDGVFDASPGAEITATIAEAIELARREKRPIVFKFNDVMVEVESHSNPHLIYRDWSRNMSGYITGRVGPHPSERLTSAELAHDAKVEAEYEARRAKSQAAYNAKVEAKRLGAEDRLKDAAPIELSDEAAWNTCRAKNSDGYGAAIVSYAERWARLMQVEIKSGRAVEDVAERTSNEADIEGITGFMYGAAVSILSKVWTHGDTLRRWHNRKTQIGTEGDRANESGGVLNPAVLNIR